MIYDFSTLFLDYFNKFIEKPYIKKFQIVYTESKIKYIYSKLDHLLFINV